MTHTADNTDDARAHAWRGRGATNGPRWYGGIGRKVLDALRAHQDHVRVTVRWHLKQRRPRPATDQTIDHLLAAARNLLLAATIIAIGG